MFHASNSSYEFGHSQIAVKDIEELNPRCLVVSPGPGAPKDAGISCDAIRTFAGRLPILGVCLGECRGLRTCENVRPHTLHER